MARLLPVAVLALLAVAPAPAVAAKRCSQLHQRDLAPAKHVRLVEQRTGRYSHRLLGCILPRGRVHEIESRAEYETETDEYDILAVAREYVMVDSSFFNQYGGGTRTAVFDLRSGRSYTLARSCSGMICTPDDPAERLTEAALNNTGESVAVITDAGGRRIVAFSVFGPTRVLDTGAVGDVRLRGRAASWTNAGEPRSAEI